MTPKGVGNIPPTQRNVKGVCDSYFTRWFLKILGKNKAECKRLTCYK